MPMGVVMTVIGNFCVIMGTAIIVMTHSDFDANDVYHSHS